MQTPVETFEITSDAVHISDPCYEVDSNYGVFSIPSRNGGKVACQ